MCGAGKYSPSTGAADAAVCQDCNAGFTLKGVSCEACPAGTFKKDSGDDACTLCKTGSFSASTGATACTPCKDGNTSPEGSSAASACWQPAQTSDAVTIEIQVILPYSRETFTQEVQVKFRAAIAASARAGCGCAITANDVKIANVETGASAGSRRRLHEASIAVDVIISAPTTDAGEKIVQEDSLSKDAINDELVKQGLKLISQVTSPPIISRAIESEKASPDPPLSSSEDAGLNWGAVIAWIVVGIVVLLAVAAASRFLAKCKTKKIQPDDEEETAGTSGASTIVAITPGPISLGASVAHHDSAPGLLRHVDSVGLQVDAAEIAAVIATWQGLHVKQEEKFVGIELKMGNSADSDLRDMLGLVDNVTFGTCMQDPLKAMESEWKTMGSKKDYANFEYVVKGKAGIPDSIPQHVKESFDKGKYHGGNLNAEDFDKGHTGWTLDDFCSMTSSQHAGLQREHVVALRLYTSDSFPLFNEGMRKKKRPHPIKTTMYVLDEALKKLRKVKATENRTEYNKIKHLWRGMKDMTLDFEKFKKEGGTELAPMSTSDDDNIAREYASQGHTNGRMGLIFELITQGHTRGLDITDFSMYPKEREFLYPTLTYLILDQTRSIKKLENGTIVVPVTPQMA